MIYFNPEKFVYLLCPHSTQTCLEECRVKAEDFFFDGLLGLQLLLAPQDIHQTRL
jgi:hypothetical protein